MKPRSLDKLGKIQSSAFFILDNPSDLKHCELDVSKIIHLRLPVFISNPIA